MKKDWITAIVTDEFNEETKKVAGKGHIASTTAGVESALASVYVSCLESQGVYFESYDERDELVERIAKSLRRYKAKAKNGGKTK